MKNSHINENAYETCDYIKKKHRILISTVAIIVLFYILFPIMLTNFISEQNKYFLPLAWGYILILFLLTWGIGIWHYFFMKRFNRSIEERVKQTNEGGGQ
ncbi:hypothetical protein SAMN04487943_108147 [Gracilibacillus orientalis]|uniref:DUF485 domain-containing protein n=1 Tax=Gracilibacillus orientalis TaxID=334253 RepID=A0A1I4NEW9_9BACI|nr:hypothetical protein [Gracilibacillus orientalis]SFM13753.1 hypothetical protein SAMN04487943_108147 [Gracilibacillus orientalis]